MQYKAVKVDASERVPDIVVENAKISLKNFSGNRFNVGGERNFRLVIEDPEMADAFSRDGWNVHIKASDDGESYMYLPVSLGYRNQRLAPKVYMVVDGQRVELTELNVDKLDDVFIESANLIIRPGYSIDENEKIHIRAWLDTMYAFVGSRNDPWADKYTSEEKPF